VRGSEYINNPFSRIIKIQDRMFKVNRIFPESQVKTYLYEDWATILKKYYHVDTIFRANNQLWLCNEIKTINYGEI
jgi:hypothetical protein